MADRAPRPLELNASRHFLSWLADAGVSLAFTTYQTNRLFLVGLKPDGRLSVFERNFDRPMGLYATPDRLYMNSRYQLWQLENALPQGEEHKGFDRLYVPRHAYTTGDLDVHDMAVDRNGRIVFVNTAYGCLATTSERYSFTPLWKPPFLSRLAPEDRCHLNGLALEGGEPAYVTAVSRSDVASGWRDRRHEGGLVMDVRSEEIVLDSLSMPHSPRLHGDDLWVLNSGTGELGHVDRERGCFEPLAFCPGFLRGLAFAGDFAIVGLSKPRRERAFAGLALDEKLAEKDSEPRCGLWVIDLKSGVVAHWLELEGVVSELYDVQVLPGVKRPMALGFKTDEIQRLITIDMSPRPVFQALSAKEPSPHPPHGEGVGGPPQANPPRAAAARAAAAESEYRAANDLLRQGDLATAVERYQSALSLDPGHVKAWSNLGTVHARLGRREAALRCYRRALAIDPASVQAHRNAASVLQSTGDLAAAIRHYEAALEATPGDGGLLSLLGLALYEDGRLAEAKGCFERAIQAAPDSAEAHNNLAGVLKVEDRLDEALALHRKAAELDPGSFLAHENIGKIHEDRLETEQARAAYGRALEIRDDPVLALHAALLCPPVFPSSAALDAYRDQAEAVVAGLEGQHIELRPERVQSSRAEPPFDWAYHGRDDLELKRRYASLFAASFRSAPLERRPSAEGPRRVGFVVTAGHEGVFARCMSGILNHLDGERFQTAVILSRARAAALRGAIRNPAVRYVNLPLRFDQAAARLRGLELDVLYYWEVGTDSTNYFLPFLRLAPVQCTGWGWPVTSAAPELDYHLTSEALALPDTDAHFSETLVRLPELPPFFYPPPIPERPHGPAHFGLAQDAHRYVCAQSLRKMHPDFDALLGGILRRDRHGVVVLVSDRHPAPAELLRERWRRTLGDVEDRLILLPHLSPEEYFHLIAGAHVVLDTLHFGGANTMYDALAAGVPPVTWPSPLPRGRYAAALCRLAGAEECVAASAEEYVETAVRLATDPVHREEMARRIRAGCSRLFENRLAVDQLERFFAEAALSVRMRSATPPDRRR